MNAFNIKEIQAVLKRKFFTDLQNSHEFNSLLDKTMIGVKYKINNLNFINSHSHLNYNLGLKKIFNKNENFFNLDKNETSVIFSFFYRNLNFFYLNHFNLFNNSYFFFLIIILNLIFSLTPFFIFLK